MKNWLLNRALLILETRRFPRHNLWVSVDLDFITQNKNSYCTLHFSVHFVADLSVSIVQLTSSNLIEIAMQFVA